MLTTICIIIFFVSVGLMFHSYILYPFLLKLFSIGKKENQQLFSVNDEQLPEVIILFSVYNEEKVISEKLESIFSTNYPLNKITVYIGSDNSTDRTNNIIGSFAAKHSQVQFFPFKERSGKSGVLNNLMQIIEQTGIDKAKTILLFSDANVMFAPTTIFELVKHFRNEQISQVGAAVLNRGVSNNGISFQEKTYVQRENKIKYLEGLNWGTMIGAFGACYVLRADCWKYIPRNYLMEDFFLSMNVLSRNKKAIMEPLAICYEDVSNDVNEEYKRKTRIQAGNFQNISTYWKLLFGFNALAFCFISHKLIRWMGPFFILSSYIANLFLLSHNQFFLFTFVLQNILLLSPPIDMLFRKMGLQVKILRFISYFYLMNFALLKGFIVYLKGIETSAWAPTKRT